MDRLYRSARLMAVIDGWATRGVFQKLADGGGQSLSDLPGDERALRITARILANAGLLVRHGEKWALSAAAAQLQSDGAFTSAHGASSFGNLVQMPDILKKGGPVVDESGESRSSTIGVYPDNPDKTGSFLRMLYRRSESSAKETAHWIDDGVDSSSSILDLGGGHGRYGRELVRLGHDATLFDLPLCIDVARDIHGDKLAYRGGDFFTDDLGGPYDVVFASNIVHGLAGEKNHRLIQRAADVLAPGGIVVLKDMFLDEFGLWPPRAVHFGLTMLMHTDEGDSYSLTEANTWFKQAGLTPLEPVIFDGFSLLSAKNSTATSAPSTGGRFFS